MNPWALTAIICFSLVVLSILVALATHLVGALLSAPQRALLVAISFAAGFCTAIGALLLRS